VTAGAGTARPTGRARPLMIRSLATLIRRRVTATVAAHVPTAPTRRVRSRLQPDRQFAALERELPARENLEGMAQLLAPVPRMAPGPGPGLLAEFRWPTRQPPGLHEYSSGGLPAAPGLGGISMIARPPRSCSWPSRPLGLARQPRQRGARSSACRRGGNVLLPPIPGRKRTTLADHGGGARSHGRVWPRGTPTSSRRKARRRVVRLHFADPAAYESGAPRLTPIGARRPPLPIDGVPTEGTASESQDPVRPQEARSNPRRRVSRNRPSLDDGSCPSTGGQASTPPTTGLCPPWSARAKDIAR